MVFRFKLKFNRRDQDQLGSDLKFQLHSIRIGSDPRFKINPIGWIRIGSDLGSRLNSI